MNKKKFTRSVSLILGLLISSAYALDNASAPNNHSSRLSSMQTLNSTTASSKIGIDGSPVTDLDQDKSGNIYASTARGAVWKYKSQTKTWDKVGGDLDNSLINGIAVDNRENIYAGTASGGIFMLSQGKANWKNINNAGSKGGYILDLVPDNTRNAIITVSSEGKINQFDSAKNKWVNIPGLPDHSIARAIQVNQKGVIYSGSTSGLVWEYKPANKNWITVGSRPGESAPIWSIATGKDGIIYAGSETGDVYKFEDSKWSVLASSTTKLSDLDKSRVWWLTEDKDGNVYAELDSTNVYVYKEGNWNKIATGGWGLHNNNGIVYIGTDGSKVLQVTDSGKTKGL